MTQKTTCGSSISRILRTVIPTAAQFAKRTRAFERRLPRGLIAHLRSSSSRQSCRATSRSSQAGCPRRAMTPNALDPRHSKRRSRRQDALPRWASAAATRPISSESRTNEFSSCCRVDARPQSIGERDYGCPRTGSRSHHERALEVHFIIIPAHRRYLSGARNPRQRHVRNLPGDLACPEPTLRGRLSCRPVLSELTGSSNVSTAASSRPRSRLHRRASRVRRSLHESAQEVSTIGAMRRSPPTMTGARMTRSRSRPARVRGRARRSPTQSSLTVRQKVKEWRCNYLLQGAGELDGIRSVVPRWRRSQPELCDQRP